MISFEIKKLQAEHSSQILNLAENEEEKSKLSQLTKWLNKESELYHIYGLFEESKLVGLSSIAFAQFRPWWSLIYLKISSGLTTNKRVAGLLKIVDYSFVYAESRGCVRVYMVNRLKKRGEFLNAQLIPLAKKIERLKNYYYISESIINAGEIPEFEYEWQLLGFETSKEEIGLVSGTRKLYEINF